jgi:uncharacterized LabA/DUF88 family protein
MRAVAYIDGFNLYYGAVRNSAYKWLNLRQTCEEIFPEYEILQVYYFTARVKRLDDDPSKPQRQDVFLQALGTIPRLEIIEGKFRKGRKRMRLVKPIDGLPDTVEVWRFEEKGSDVNLASWMLRDGFTDLYDVAIVFSNDSDLVAPIRMVRDDLGKIVMVINPQKSRPSNDLRLAASEVRTLTPEVLEKCQLPERIALPNGRIIYRPSSWGASED